jgi:hypothetical protein
MARRQKNMRLTIARFDQRLYDNQVCDLELQRIICEANASYQLACLTKAADAAKEFEELKLQFQALFGEDEPLPTTRALLRRLIKEKRDQKGKQKADEDRYVSLPATNGNRFAVLAKMSDDGRTPISIPTVSTNRLEPANGVAMPSDTMKPDDGFTIVERTKRKLLEHSTEKKTLPQHEAGRHKTLKEFKFGIPEPDLDKVYSFQVFLYRKICKHYAAHRNDTRLLGSEVGDYPGNLPTLVPLLGFTEAPETRHFPTWVMNEAPFTVMMNVVANVYKTEECLFIHDDRFLPANLKDTFPNLLRIADLHGICRLRPVSHLVRKIKRATIGDTNYYIEIFSIPILEDTQIFEGILCESNEDGDKPVTKTRLAQLTLVKGDVNLTLKWVPVYPTSRLYRGGILVFDVTPAGSEDKTGLFNSYRKVKQERKSRPAFVFVDVPVRTTTSTIVEVECRNESDVHPLLETQSNISC